MANALVPVLPASRRRPPAEADARASAAFVSHLIATAERLPQTRVRRRAEPEHAVSAYRAVGQWPSEPGRALSRSL